MKIIYLKNLAEKIKGRGSRQGSMMVLALMVSMLLMLLITASVTFTIIETENIQDYARNKKSFQAADSGVAHGNRTLSRAIEAWEIPQNTSPDDVESWAADAESGTKESNRDISMLTTAALNIDDILPRGQVSTSHTTNAGSVSSSNPDVAYDVTINVEPREVTWPADGDISHRTKFKYQYDIVSQGVAQIGGNRNQATRVESGAFEVEVKRPSFATYGYFTNSMRNQYDNQLVFFDGEVYEGPTHVNSAPPEGRAGFWGTPIFNGNFSAVQDSYAESWLGGNADPEFNGGVNWGAEQITLPENGWSQLRASIGDYENVTDGAQPDQGDIRERLGLPDGDTEVDPGVYVTTELNIGNEVLGGIFINGDADEISFDVDGASQLIKVKQTNPSGTIFAGQTDWLIKTDFGSDVTKIYKDGTLINTVSSAVNGLIHIEGDVKSLKGDGDADGADIGSNSKITISVTGDVTVDDHITYEDDPRTIDNAENIFGIFSSGGNVWLGESAPNNLNLHATVMATGDGKGVGAEGLAINGGYDGSYAEKGTWNLLGGLIEDKNQTTGVYYSGSGRTTGYTWNFDYDERFLEGSAPPYFPYVTKFFASMLGKEAENWGRKYY